MPHFGAPYIRSPVRCCTTQALLSLSGDTAFPVTVGVDTRQPTSVIGDAALHAIFQRNDYGSVVLDVQLITIPDEANLKLVGYQAHVSEPRSIRFEIASGWKLPKQLGVLLGNDFVQFWRHHPWGLGLILSRHHIDCAPV